MLDITYFLHTASIDTICTQKLWRHPNAEPDGHKPTLKS